MWAHPDLMPSAADLDEPAGLIDRVIGGGLGGIGFPEFGVGRIAVDPPEGGSAGLTDGPVDS